MKFFLINLSSTFANLFYLYYIFIYFYIIIEQLWYEIGKERKLEKVKN